MNLFNKARGKFVADVDEIRPQYQDSNLSDGAAVFNSSLVRSVGPSIGATIDQLDALTLTEVGSLNELATPWYADQVLPFDITLAGANEYGAMTAAKVFGVEILNEGSGISIDDAVSEAQATFVARGVEPMQAVPSPPDQGISSCGTTEARAHARRARPCRRPAVVQEVIFGILKNGRTAFSDSDTEIGTQKPGTRPFSMFNGNLWNKNAGEKQISLVLVYGDRAKQRD